MHSESVNYFFYTIISIARLQFQGWPGLQVTSHWEEGLFIYYTEENICLLSGLIENQVQRGKYFPLLQLES